MNYAKKKPYRFDRVLLGQAYQYDTLQHKKGVKKSGCPLKVIRIVYNITLLFKAKQQNYTIRQYQCLIQS